MQEQEVAGASSGVGDEQRLEKLRLRGFLSSWLICPCRKMQH